MYHAFTCFIRNVKPFLDTSVQLDLYHQGNVMIIRIGKLVISYYMEDYKLVTSKINYETWLAISV